MARTPVDDNDYQIPTGFAGKLTNLTITLKPEQTAQGEVGLPPRPVRADRRDIRRLRAALMEFALAPK